VTQPRTTFEDREEIRGEARNGEHHKAIATRRGLHPDTVRKIIKMRGSYNRDDIRRK